jgi:hypothetical protein
MTLLKKLRRFFASALVLLFVAVTLAAAPARAEKAPFDFMACVKKDRIGSVLVLMDESGTIYTSDSKNMRVTGAQILADNLQDFANLTGGEIQVQFAGLGDTFKSRSNGWVSIKAGESVGSEQLKRTAGDIWVKAPSDKNYRETDMLSSIAGAQKELQAAPGCKLMVMFKDGTDWQFFNQGVSTPVEGFANVQALLAEGKFSEAKALAAQEICRDMGLSDGLRNKDVYTLAVALGQGSFSELNSFVAGDCGSLPAWGKLLSVSSASDLPFLFSEALGGPSIDPTVGPFSFTMSSALQSFSILSSSDSPFQNFQVIPPQDCTFNEPVSFGAALVARTGALSSDVTWTSYKYGLGETVRVVVKHKNRVVDPCWNGEWKIQPNSSNAKSVFEIDPNLQATAVFADEDIFLIPGGAPTEFQVKLEQTEGESQVDIASIEPSVGITVTGYLVDSRGTIVRDLLPGGSISRDQIEQPLLLEVDENVSFGQYKLQLTMALDVPGIDSSYLKKVVWERNIEVRGEIASPTILGGSINFGDIIGTEAKGADVTIQNNSDKDLILDFKKSTVLIAQGPEGAQYEIVDSGQTVNLPAKESTTANIQIRMIKNDQIGVSGILSGELQLVAQVAGADAGKKVEFQQEFYGVQKAELDAEVATWTSIVILIFMGLLTLLSIYLVNSFSSRFPKKSVLTSLDLAAAQFSAKVTENGIELTESHYGSTDKWQHVELGSSTRVAKLADVEFVAKSPGLKLAGNSYGLQKGLSGFGSLNNLQTGDIRQPKISLSLQNSFAVFVTEQELVSWAKDNTEIECEVLIVIPSDGLDSGGTESAVIKINQNLLAARDSIKKLEVSDKVANQERSGLKLPSAITSRFEGVTEALKSLTTKMPKSEKPERARKSEKNKQSEDKASQGQTDDSYDPFNQPG